MAEIDELHYYCMDDVGWKSLEAVLWIRIRIRIHIKVISWIRALSLYLEVRIWIRIRVISRIRIRIKVMRIHNTVWK